MHKYVIAVVFFNLIRQELTVRCQNHSTGKNHSEKIHVDEQKVGKSFLINSPGCKILRNDIFNEKLEPLINRMNPCFKRPYCELIDKKYKPPLVGSDRNSLFVLQNSMKFYQTNLSSNFECSYIPFWNTEPYVEDLVTFGKEIFFKNEIRIPENIEYVQVSCYIEGKTVYIDVHSFVPNKRSKLSQNVINRSHDNSNSTETSVLVFGVENLSRLNFHRQMPETKHVMNQLQFIEFFGYHRIANNTLENMISVLSGQTLNELEYSCLSGQIPTFDECPLIWKDFKDNDFLTAFIEEENPYTESDLRFNYIPSDYYYHSFQKMASVWLKHTIFKKSYLCMGPRLSSKSFLNYAKKFALSLKDEKFFAFFSELLSSKDDMNLPHISDNLHADFIRFLKEIGLTEKCVIVFFSYAGSGYKQIEDSNLEERLPLFKVSLPNWFRNKYPWAYENFLKNTEILTTHFDAYETLSDLTNLGQIENDMILDRISLLHALEELPRSISLFLPIPNERTCADAGIEYDHCCCQIQNNNYNNDANFIKNSGEFVISYINSLLAKRKGCSKLSLKFIKDVKFKKFWKTKKKRMIITVIASPGDVEFEAAMEGDLKSSNHWTKSITSIKRNNYLNNRYCSCNDDSRSYCCCV